jgi:hypothetical protein
MLMRTLVLAAWLLTSAPALAQSRLTHYKSRCYDVYTDLPAPVAREIVLRADLMVVEYSARTRAFARTLNQRLPLYVYSRSEDYLAAGALPGSAGMFMAQGDGGGRLLVLAGPQVGEQTWDTLKHEGFHQFVHAVIGGDIPVWVNEGLAEYFGAGIFTGDGYITGVVPPGRLRQLRLLLSEGKMRPLRDMMLTRHEEWNSNLSVVNYLQAWSMVHFLAHANPRYEQAFNQFILDVSRGMQWEAAWRNRFGADVASFERRWREYWTALEPSASLPLYQRGVVHTLTNYYARAASQKQTFESADAFFKAAKGGELRAHEQDWLPPSLLEHNLVLAGQMGNWTIDPRRRTLACRTNDGSVLTGSFQLNGRRVKPSGVSVKVSRQQP